MKEEGDKINIQLSISGAHMGELNIPDGPTVPPTNRNISFPQYGGTVTIKEGKVYQVEMETSPEGGMPGILKQLGVDMPH